MSPIPRTCLASAFAVLAAYGSSVPAARAQGDRTQTPREAAEDTRHPVAVTLNPLGFAVQRYGANLEVLPVAHHALVGSAYFQSMPMWIIERAAGRNDVHDPGGASLGGELGYRIYSGTKGADGAFAGASFIVMPLAYARVADDLRSADLVRFSAPGAALDLGVQKVTDSGFTLGGGVGVMYLAYQLPNDSRRIPLSIEPHVLPRLLLTAGWSF